MFQTPIGGVSFLVNLLIIWMSMILRMFKNGYTKRYLVTQAGIKRIEEGTIGFVLSRTFVIMFPIFIICVLSFLSVTVLYRLHEDERKISIVDAVRWSGAKAYRGVELVRENHLIPRLPFTKSSPQNEILFTTVSATERTTSSASVLQPVVQESPRITPVISDTAFANEFVFLSGRELTSLTRFMIANDIGSTFPERKLIAEYFGIPAYRGTQEENEKLLQILKALTNESLDTYITHHPQ